MSQQVAGAFVDTLKDRIDKVKSHDTLIKEYETGKTRKSELNEVIYEASKIVLKDRKVPLPKM